MKKNIFSILFVFVLLITTTSAVFADDGDTNTHKIENKWDLMGTFTGTRGWSGDTINYEVHIKEAMMSSYSKGVIKFESGGKSITAHVEDMKLNYPYWYGYSGHPKITNIASVGWAEYNNDIYYFMFIHNANCIWIALSTTSYANAWESGKALGNRAFELHSSVITNQFVVAPK